MIGNLAAVGLVSRREIGQRLRDKGFLVSTAITVVIILAGSLIPLLIEGGPAEFEVGVVGADFVVESEVPGELGALVQGRARELRLRDLARSEGIPKGELAQVLDPAPVATSPVNPPDPQRETLTLIAGVGVFLLYIQMIAYGYWVSMGSSRRSRRASSRSFCPSSGPPSSWQARSSASGSSAWRNCCCSGWLGSA